MQSETDRANKKAELLTAGGGDSDGSATLGLAAVAAADTEPLTTSRTERGERRLKNEKLCSKIKYSAVIPFSDESLGMYENISRVVLYKYVNTSFIESVFKVLYIFILSLLVFFMTKTVFN